MVQFSVCNVFYFYFGRCSGSYLNENEELFMCGARARNGIF